MRDAGQRREAARPGVAGEAAQHVLEVIGAQTVLEPEDR